MTPPPAERAAGRGVRAIPKAPTGLGKPGWPPARSRRVLVLDDHPADRALMADLLRRAGYRVLEAGLAVEVVALTAALPPALLVIDIFLPGPSGADLIRQLRATAAFAETPILAVSAAGTNAVRHLALEAGATAFLEKFLDHKTFLDTVTHLLEKPPVGEGIRQGQGT